MIVGQITADDEAVIPITLVAEHRRIRTVAVVDTGFTGYLSVPVSVIDATGWSECGTETYELANGEEIEERIFLGHVVLDGVQKPARVVRSRSHDILIGTKLLAGRLCEFDYVTRVVRIRRGGVVRASASARR